jgi:glutathione S-transferase
VKLYVSNGSPNARRALLARAHMGLEAQVEVQEVDLRKGEHLQPWFLALNPNHKVPTLVDGDLVLWESNAILQYFAGKAGRTDLWPSEPGPQADVSRWQLFVHTHFNLAVNPLVFEKVLKKVFGRGEPDPAVIEAKTKEVREVFAVLEGALDGHDWLACDRLTLADLALGASLGMGLAAGLPFAEFPRLDAWFGRIRALPAWVDTEPRPL